MYYKVLNDDGSAIYGQGKWFLPKGKRPGKWMPKIEHIEVCESGYHLCRKNDLLNWLGPVIWVAEGRKNMIEGVDKVVFQQARLIEKVDNWNETTARLFACDCAERSLIIYEKYYHDDNRPREAVEIARLYANGKVTKEDLAAAWDAARAAARAASWDAAWAAAWDAARAAAWDAARDASWAAAWDAARDAAWDAEREWQNTCLLEYLNGKRP